MLLDKRVVLKERLRKLLSNVAHNLPIGWAEVGTEREATLEKQEISQDVGKSSHDVRVVLQLTETTLDVVGMQHDVTVGVRDAQIPNADQ